MSAHQLSPHRADPLPPDTDTGEVPDRGDGWAQVVVEFTDWADAARTVEHHLRPLLPDRRWWYIRKHPHWRLRHRLHDPDHVHRHLDTLTTAGVLRGWHTSTYEPETHAFGGPGAMSVAHELFCHDTTAALALTRPDTPVAGGRRTEVSVLAISRMLRAATLEPYEQGDVWARVADLRGSPPTHTGRPHAPYGGATSVRRLLTLDTGPTSPLIIDGPLTPLSTWLDAYTTAGRRLADLARTGGLHRGLRAVLAYHVLFHWNRLAIPADQQDTLARLARDTLIPPDTCPPR